MRSVSEDDPPVPPQKSAQMRNVGRKNTTPELLVRRWLHSRGFRFRLHRRDLPGTPDIVLVRYKVAVFVHGCFWHRHSGCKRATTPQVRSAFWKAKFAANLARDRSAQERLHSLGWSPVVVWECQATNPAALETIFRDVLPQKSHT
jgi:DNA mismatch endonuclease (patch repair protein)